MQTDLDFSTQAKKVFTYALMHWHEFENTRSLPWQVDKNPYHIWLSEILLQQTRTEQGIPYYIKYISSFPTITNLANASDQEVFKLWEGLGYYNRCNNMLATARYIRDERNGIFPDSYDEIRQLKGVGDYTAAAIASFAYNLPYAVVDGNVYRVLSRYYGIAKPIDTTVGKHIFKSLAQSLLDTNNPGAYNQAIMDLGATVCTPKLPKCMDCPLSKNCVALKQDLIADLPVKEKKLIVKNRYFNYLVLIYKDQVWIQERLNKDIWQHLNEFYLVEKNNEQLLTEQELNHILGVNYNLQETYVTKQKLTHQLIYTRFYILRLSELPKIITKDNFIPIKNLKNYAFPKTILSFLNRMPYF